jgi:integrase
MMTADSLIDAFEAKRAMTISKSQVKRLKAQSGAPAFKDQAAIWLANGASRKRNPLRLRTLTTYRTSIRTLIPLIGELPLDTIGNKVLNDVAAALSVKGLKGKPLKPASIQLILNVAKEIRESARNEDGQPLYPCTWNAETIDAPVVDKRAQETPMASTQAIGEAIKRASPVTGALIAVLASTGMRVGEALALHLDVGGMQTTVWNPEESKIIVREQRDGKTFGPPKTDAGIREVDLAPVVNDYLKRIFPPINPNGLLMFPLSESEYRSQIIEAGLQGGFHTLRRHRVTHIQLQGVPESLVKFWTGHAGITVTDSYTKVGTEIQARKAQAERVGIGFELP